MQFLGIVGRSEATAERGNNGYLRVYLNKLGLEEITTDEKAGLTYSLDTMGDDESILSFNFSTTDVEGRPLSTTFTIKDEIYCQHLKLLLGACQDG